MTKQVKDAWEAHRRLMLRPMFDDELRSALVDFHIEASEQGSGGDEKSTVESEGKG